jgi:hypothetical protein
MLEKCEQTAWQYHSGGGPEHIDRAGTLTAGELIIRSEELFSQ